MRAPSFRDELTTFRDSRKPPLKPRSRGPDGLGNRNSADTALMNRWLDEDRAHRAEEIWGKVKRKAPSLTAAEFIKAVLTKRRSAAASVNRTVGVPGIVRGFDAEWAEFLPDLKKRVAERLSGSPAATTPISLAETLEDAAREIRILHQSYFGFFDQVEFGLTRQGQNSDRSRVAFYRLMGAYLHEHCQERHYEAIAFLAEIAFPGREIDAEAVRDALRPRRRKKLKPTRR
jgi:hypothetical protein